MNYEEKYNIALANAEVYHNITTNTEVKNWLEYAFPELRKSEDERIRKGIICGMNALKEQHKETFASIPINDCIAWLEKQGEQNKQQLYDIIISLWDLLDKIDTFSDLQIDDTNPDDPFRKIEDITQERHKFVHSDGYNLFLKGEQITGLKQDEQEFVDKVESKFKVGDWVVYNRDDSSKEIIQVYDMRDNRYYFNDNIHFSWSIKECDEKSHLWTIRDAKDGDVLATKKGNPFIYDKDRYNNGLAYYYAGLDVNKELTLKSPHHMLAHFGELNSVSPATKEQRDLLFQKMKEAGYEWDAEKKELNKIEKQGEKKPAPKFKIGDTIHKIGENTVFPMTIEKIEDGDYVCNNSHSFVNIKFQDDYELVEQKTAWSEEDEDVINHLLAICAGAKKYRQFAGCLQEDITKYQTWLKFLKERVQPQTKQEWSEEDEANIDAVWKACGQVYGTEYQSILGDWLKSLKDRVQSKQEWGEYDKIQLSEAIQMVEANGTWIRSEDAVKKVSNWLKSIKPHWKPSEEQMAALVIAVHDANGRCYYEKLFSIYNDLKKL